MFNIKTTKQKFAFTLTEILITLGIIGVVAIITIPTLVKNQQQQVLLSKLKKSYSIVSQAIKLSEAENGASNTWSYPTSGDTASALSWFNSYLAQYMKYYYANPTNGLVIVKLNDGTDIGLIMGSSNLEVTVYLHGYDNAIKNGRDIFYFEIVPGSIRDTLVPFSNGASGNGRSQWTESCSSSVDVSNRKSCAGLIMYDGWQIASDYPW